MCFEDKEGFMRRTMNKMLLKDIETTEPPATWYFCPYCQKRLFKGHIETLRMTCPNCNRLIESEGEPLLESK
jgi:acetyl-CoA carboxylase beta subunit